MKDITKYQGVIPAFYACYDAEGNISTEGVKALTRHLIAKGVKGVYVGGSSGECIYQHVDERKAVLEAVVSEAKGKLTVIAHVGCNNTADSVELARHAESVGVDAIASIPPIYFHLPEYAIAKYWNDMSAAAPNTEFVIYNIPQLAGTGLTMSLLREMLKNPNVVAVKNSSMPTQDIQMFKDAGIAARGEGNFVVFNGPDEQFVSGRVIGADGGIGGTYAVMPELYLAMNEHINKGEIEAARAIQYDADRINFDASIAGGDEITLFRNGTLQMAFCWNIAQQLNADNNDAGLTNDGDEIMPMAFPTASGDPKLCGGIWGFGVFDNGDEAKVKAAKTFIEFIAADPDQVKDSVLASTYFPVRASVGDIYADNAIMSEYTKFMAYLGDYYQITPGWATARTEWWNMLQRVGTGEDVATSVATFVQNANAAAAAEA